MIQYINDALDILYLQFVFPSFPLCFQPPQFKKRPFS